MIGGSAWDQGHPRVRPGFLVMLVITTLLLLSGCSDRIGHGFDWKRMRVQSKYNAYGTNPMFRDSAAMRVPPAGTVAREAIPVTAPPPSVDLARGGDRFHIYCAVCHGDRGDGVSVVASNMDDPKPPSLLTGAPRTLDARQLFAVITDGIGRMPPFASQLPVADRWQIIAYLGQLQAGAPVSAADSPPDTTARPIPPTQP